MAISKETVEELARVCRLSLTREETEQYARDLGALEEMASALLSVEMTATERENMALPLDALRKDEIKPCLSRAELLHAAPARSDEYIAVPRTVEEV